MKTVILALVSLSLVAGCGGYHQAKRYNRSAPAPVAAPVPAPAPVAQVPTQTYIPITPGAQPVVVATAPTTTTVRPVARPTSAPRPVAVAAPAPKPAPAPVRRTASGPISKACLASDRKARSRSLCGCIQAVADQTLTASEQRRAATFYRDPQKAQDIRQADGAANERFWKRYKAYGEAASRSCG